MITPMRVFVLIINAGTDNEGIHTVKLGHINKILMFESEDDATRYALMLEAQDFPTPSVEAIDAEEIKEFCESAGYEWEYVPVNNDLVIPPEIVVEETDWQIDDLDSDEEDLFDSPPPAQEMSDSELESLRRRLEGLL